MRRKSIIVTMFASAVAVAFTAKVGFAQDGASVQRGASVARSLCADCHAVVAGGRSPNTAAPPFAVIAATPGMTTLALEAALGTTHRTMPNVMLERADRADVFAYIQSLKPNK